MEILDIRENTCTSCGEKYFATGMDPEWCSDCELMRQDVEKHEKTIQTDKELDKQARRSVSGITRRAFGRYLLR